MNIGGVLADKYNRKRSLLLLQSISVFIDAFLIFLLINNNLSLGFLLAYGAVIGVLGAFGRPFNQSILLELFDKDDVSEILGFNSVIFNLCRIFVPILIGILLVDHEYMIVGLSMVLSCVSLIFYSLLSCKTYNNTQEESSFFELFSGQKDIIMKYPDLMKIFFVAMIVSMTLGSYTFLIPALNEFLHNGNPSSLSYLYGISGIGALSAGLLKIYKINIKINFIPFLGVIASIAMAVLIFQDAFFIEFAAFYILALSILLLFISCSQAVYDTSSEDQQGRLLSILGMAIIGVAPFSNAMTGFFVSWWGLESVCLFYAIISGLFCLGLSFKMNKELAPL